MSDQPFLGAYGITFRWSPSTRRGGRDLVLDEVSFEIEKGEILALLGPNGSGKSTLMKLASGLLSLHRPGCSGQVHYLGIDFLSISANRRAQKVAYVGPEFKTEFPLTAQEAVFLGRTCQGHGFFQRASRQDDERVRWAMDLCLCWKLKDRLLNSLSGGERQLVSLARALAQGARILFLDETLSRMDLDHQAAIGKMLKNLASQGWSILLVSHDVNLASEWADRGLFLKEGKKLFQGPIREILNQENIRTLYPGPNLTVGYNPNTGAPKVFFGKMD